MPFQTEKYYYFQVTNDTDIADLETAIQNALDALDVNGTQNAEVVYDTDAAQFSIYNNTVADSQDWNEIKVDVRAASGSAIRQGFILQDSTDKTVNGTRLSLVAGGLAGNMEPENLGIIDYQTDTLKLDYGDVDSSEQIYAEVVNTRLSIAYDRGVGGPGGAITLAEWASGYKNEVAGVPTLKMINQTDKLSVNGTYWTRVDYFSGAANEYVISDNYGASSPVIYFNTAAGLHPQTNDAIVFEFRPSNAPVIQLSENANYTIDASTGNISLVWSGANTAPGRVIVTTDGAGVVNRLSGQIKITAQYTTEKRLMSAPTTIMDSRWADFAMAYAEVSDGGDGKARTDFNNMWGSINNKIGSNPDPIIYDQATSTQPTQKGSSRFLSGETHRTSLDVYDSLGTIHELQFVFTHVGSYYDTAKQERYTNQWFWRAELPYSDVFAYDSMDNIDAIAQGVSRMKGSLTFNDNGMLQSTALAGNTGPIMFDPSPVGMNGNSTHNIDTLSIEVDFLGHSGDPIDGVTQYASDSTTLAYEQNGWAMGILQTFGVDQTGIIQGSYSNGVVKPIGQLALAIFPNEEGLTKLGANLFDQSANTGTPTLVPAYVGGAGSIQGGALEMSNVDIAEEFTKMIITERGFQANSRIITTSDEMLTEVINLKR
jgi:flagellar hook-basal body protein